jgi:hypothetical protein
MVVTEGPNAGLTRQAADATDFVIGTAPANQLQPFQLTSESR